MNIHFAAEVRNGFRSNSIIKPGRGDVEFFQPGWCEFRYIQDFECKRRNIGDNFQSQALRKSKKIECFFTQCCCIAFRNMQGRKDAFIA